MRPRRDRTHSVLLHLIPLEDRTVPSGDASTVLPSIVDPIDHEHGGLNFLPESYSFFSQTSPYLLTGPQDGDPTTLALQTLEAYAASLGLSQADVANTLVTDSYSDGPGQTAHVYLRQQFNGLAVINADLGIHLTDRGEVISINGGFVPGLGALDSGTGLPPAPGLTAVEAVAAAMAYFGVPATAPPTLASAGSDAAQTSRVSAPGVESDTVSANLAYANTPNGARLVWELQFGVPGGDHYYDAAVDAQTGEVVFWADWVSNLATYNVFPSPLESPLDGPRQFVVDPANPTASPFGWHDTNGAAGPEFLDTRGNNVFAQEDQDDNDTGGSRPSGGPSLFFDSTFNPLAQPTAYVDALVTNLFYTNNFLHDTHYAYGFTEAAGNFQQNNYGNGGAGSDAVQADAIDGSGINNANFFTPPDGSAPRMQMYRFTDFTHTPPNPINRDSDFDNGVIIHEFGHGVSNRLTGGPSNANALNALQSGGMGEGWSDFWSLMFTQVATDQKNDTYGMGNYVLFNPANGPGIRQFPYSFDLSTVPSPLTGTFADYGLGTNKDVEVHWTGTLWAAVLWDMNWLLIDKYGFDPDLSTGYNPSTAAGRAGNKLALQLVMDALKSQPANPTFIQARNEILAADRQLTGGQNQREIWTAFARRGLGAGAITPNANSTSLNTSFAMPSGADLPAIIAQSPNGLTNTLPTSLKVTFSEDMDTSSFSVASDVASFTGPGGVDLKGSITGFTWNSATELEIFFTAPAGNAAQGEYALVLEPTILALNDGSPLDQNFNGTAGEASDGYTAYFQFDAIPLTATAQPAAGAGAILTVNDSIIVTFSEPVNPLTVGTDDLSLSQGTVTGVTLLAPDMVRYDITGMGEPSLYITLKYGAVTDPFGFPVQALNANFPVDVTTTGFPTPLLPLGPTGWQSYEGFASGRITFGGDTDTYTLPLDASTRLTVIADQLQGIRGTINVFDPLGNLVGSGSSSLIGASILLPTINANISGNYTIEMGAVGASTGKYRVHVLVGTLAENEVYSGNSNNSTFSAESIGGRMINYGSGASGISVLGSVGRQFGFPGTTDSDDYYSFTVQPGESVSVGLQRLSAGTGTLPTIQLLDQSGASVGTLTTPTNFDQAINFVTPAGTPQTYSIRVSGLATTTTSHDYLMSVVHHGVMDTEANDTSASARSVLAGETARGGLTAGDEDWYSITLAAAGDLYISSATPAGGIFEYQNTLDPRLELWDDAGTTLMASDDNGSADGRNALVSATALAAGTYRLRVLGTNATTAGEYTVFFDGNANPAPVAVSAGGPYEIAEGDSLVLSATATDPNNDPLTYGWDLNGDNKFIDATGPNPTIDWATLQKLAPPINDGPAVWPVRVRVSDGTTVIISSTTTLTIDNSPPTATDFAVVGSSSIAEGSGATVAFTAPFTDPSGPDTALGFHFAYDFDNDGKFDAGDGTYAGSGTSKSIAVPASFLNDGPGVVTVRGRIIDRDDGFTDYFAQIVINNVAPTAAPIFTPFPFPENGIGTVSLANATDPSPTDTAAGFHFSFDFDNNGIWDVGDGATYAGSSLNPVQVVPSSFFPEGPASLTVRVRVFDKDEGFSEYTTTVPIANVPPTGTVTGDATVDEGSPATINIDVNSIVDPSTADTAAGFRYSFDFGDDGMWDLGDGTYAGSGGVQASATVPASFLDDGVNVLPVRVRILDRDDGRGDTIFYVTVNNVAPTATLAAATTVDIGSPFVVSLLAPFDPSTADTTAGFTYSFDFDGNGDFTDPGDVSNSTSNTASFPYQTPGLKTYRVRVADKDGGFNEYTATVTVQNVPPVVAIAPIAPLNEGSTATINVGATHPSTVTTAAGFTYSYDLDGNGTFDLGDGLTYAGSVPDAVVAVPPGLLDDGGTTRTVRVRVFEVNGLFADQFIDIQVLNVAPTGTFTAPTGRIEVQTPATFSFTGVTDPSAADTASGFRYSFDLNNDGDFTDPGEVADSTSASIQAQFTLAGPTTVRGRVSDKDGGFTDYTLAVVVSPLTKTYFAAGVDADNDPRVKLYDSTGVEKLSRAVFDPSARGGVRVAVGDVNGDGTPDLIAGTGPGSTAQVQVLDGRTGVTLFSAQPFGDFTGGVFVASGDIDGDGLADIAVSPDQSGGPRVVIYNSRNRGQVASFFAIDDPNFRGGARIAMADVNGDGLSDLLVAAGFGGGPRVAGFDARFLTTTRQKLFGDFFAFSPDLRNGVYIAGGDIDGDGRAEVVAGAGPGGGPQVIAFSGAGLLGGEYNQVINFFAGDTANRGGIRVAVTDFDGDHRADIVTGEATGPHLNIYLAANTVSTGRPLDALELLPFSAPMNGIFVG